MGSDARYEAALSGMVREWLALAEAKTLGSPEQHCRRLLDAALIASVDLLPVGEQIIELRACRAARKP